MSAHSNNIHSLILSILTEHPWVFGCICSLSKYVPWQQKLILTWPVAVANVHLNLHITSYTEQPFGPFSKAIVDRYGRVQVYIIVHSCSYSYSYCSACTHTTSCMWAEIQCVPSCKSEYLGMQQWTTELCDGQCWSEYIVCYIDQTHS